MTPRPGLARPGPCTRSRSLALSLAFRAFRAGRALIGLACLVVLSATACEKPPAADTLKEWTAADHHSTDDDKASGVQGPQVRNGAQGAMPSGPAPAGGSTDNSSQLVDLTWRQQCATCHGSLGRGDGQMGPMVQAPDLTRADWQARVSDAEVAAIIKNGKNKMPRFDVPEPVLQGLVARIRSLRAL